MPKTIKYIGTQRGWPELAATGKQSSWNPGQMEQRSDSEAALLLATGQFMDQDATNLDEAERIALSALVSVHGIQAANRAVLLGDSITQYNNAVVSNAIANQSRG